MVQDNRFENIDESTINKIICLSMKFLLELLTSESGDIKNDLQSKNEYDNNSNLEKNENLNKYFYNFENKEHISNIENNFEESGEYLENNQFDYVDIVLDGDKKKCLEILKDDLKNVLNNTEIGISVGGEDIVDYNKEVLIDVWNSLAYKFFSIFLMNVVYSMTTSFKNYVFLKEINNSAASYDCFSPRKEINFKDVDSFFDFVEDMIIKEREDIENKMIEEKERMEYFVEFVKDFGKRDKKDSTEILNKFIKASNKFISDNYYSLINKFEMFIKRNYNKKFFYIVDMVSVLILYGVIKFVENILKEEKKNAEEKINFKKSTEIDKNILVKKMKLENIDIKKQNIFSKN